MKMVQIITKAQSCPMSVLPKFNFEPSVLLFLAAMKTV